MKAEVRIDGRGISVGYRLGRGRIKQVHSGLDFSLYEGELTCLLGPNGAGKSTLLKTLSGLHKPLSGTLTLYGRPCPEYSTEERSRMLGVVLTDKTYAGGLRVHELVTLGRHPYTGFFGRLTTEDHRIADQAMIQVGIQDKAESYVSELSDGERQKVMIAKVLAQQCPVILLDEPTAFLDVASRIEVMALLHRLSREESKTVLVCTHDMEQTLLLADRLWLLSRERGMVCGVTEDLILNGSLNRFFSRGDITFDVRTGTFRGIYPLHRSMALAAESEELWQWSSNVLKRNGYNPQTETGSHSIGLHVYSPNDLELRFGDQTPQRYGSFEELLSRLKSNS